MPFSCFSLFVVRGCFFFFFNDTATTEIYTLSLHDALPISSRTVDSHWPKVGEPTRTSTTRSEEHTSELQSRGHLVCRLLLEKKKPPTNPIPTYKNQNRRLLPTTAWTTL